MGLPSAERKLRTNRSAPLQSGGHIVEETPHFDLVAEMRFSLGNWSAARTEAGSGTKNEAPAGSRRRGLFCVDIVLRPEKQAICQAYKFTKFTFASIGVTTPFSRVNFAKKRPAPKFIPLPQVH